MLMGALAMASTSVVTSCSDYDDDISNLQSQIDAISSTLSSLEAQINAGSVITSVNSVSNGVTVTLSNGQTFTITNGADGADGKDGKDGIVWTIGSDGYWYQDGVKTDYYALGTKGDKGDKGDTGETGAAGADGADGADGANGYYYVPNPETGCFDIYQDDANGNAVLIQQTSISYKGIVENQVSAILSNDQLILTGVQSTDGTDTYVISLYGTLSSLVFVPNTYIDGIEAIRFASLEYREWTELEADKADGEEAVIINDAQQVEEYFVNPENVSLDDIDSLYYVSNDAQNIITRATSEVSSEAPIKVVAQELAELDGHKTLQVTLGKNGTSSLGDDETNFTIVALKAVVTDENGVSNAVYSDWARLYETTTTPYIHSTLEGFGVDAAGKMTEDVDGDNADAHYWSYSEVYNGSTKATKLSSDFADKHIATTVYYKDTLDLNTLVMVCDKNGTSFDLEKYGLAFEFNLIDYILDNENATSDDTNQKHFGKIVDGSKIISTARDNETTANRDAIGKQPMVQAVLKDTVNNKVVDVRYFKIKWIDESNFVEADFDVEDTTGYVCDGNVSIDVLEEAVNKIYTQIVEGGMTRDEFHANYSLDTNLYASAAEAMKGSSASADATLGTIEDLADQSADGQTHNLRWTLNTTDQKFTAAEYEAGYKTVEAYARFISNSNAESGIVIKVTMTLTIPQITAAYNRDGAMWSGDVRTVNPLLETDVTADETTVYQASLLKGYIIEGKTPGENADLATLKGAAEGVSVDEVKFVFDESKLSELKKNDADDKWTVSEDGTELLYNDGVAATIDNVNDKIYLAESDFGKTDSEPSTGALLLIGDQAPVKLVAEWCDYEVTLEELYFEFMTPLVFEDDEVEVTLYDIVPGGSKSESFAGTLIIREQFASVMTNNRIVWDNADPTKAVAGLDTWYGVEALVYDTDNAMINVNKNGAVTSDCTTLLTDIKNADETPKYTVEVDEAASTVTFYNMSGNAIAKDIKIEIPVSVETKWQKDVMKATIVVTIKANI